MNLCLFNWTHIKTKITTSGFSVSSISGQQQQQQSLFDETDNFGATVRNRNPPRNDRSFRPPRPPSRQNSLESESPRHSSTETGTERTFSLFDSGVNFPESNCIWEMKKSATAKNIFSFFKNLNLL